jgi:ClpP class serine protease
MFRRRRDDDAPPSLLDRLGGLARLAFWVLLIYLLVSQFLASGALQRSRAEALGQFQQERKSRLIALIHRQDRVSFLGVPVGSYINIEDSEAVLRAIRLTPDDQPIDLILHTPGGLVLASEQIARALLDHKGKVTVFVPHYAMSGGTLIALAADEIVMDPNAVLGPVDPQVGGAPAASILRVVEQKPVERINDATLVLADVSRKAQAQVQAFVTELLAQSGQMSQDQAAQSGKALTEGRWTHDFPINVRLARELGLKVSTQMPVQVYRIMELYPQSQSGRPSVLYIEPPRTPREVNAPDGPAAVPQRPDSK